MQIDDDDEEEEEEAESDGEGWDSDETGTDISHDDEVPNPASVPEADTPKPSAKSTKADTSKKADGGTKKGQ